MTTVHITKTTEGYEVQALNAPRIYCFPTIGKAQKMQRRLLDAVIDSGPKAMELAPDPIIASAAAALQHLTDQLDRDPDPCPHPDIKDILEKSVVDLKEFVPGAIPNKAREEISEYDRSVNGSALQAQMSKRIQAIKARRDQAPVDRTAGELRLPKQPEAL